MTKQENQTLIAILNHDKPDWDHGHGKVILTFHTVDEAGRICNILYPDYTAPELEHLADLAIYSQYNTNDDEEHRLYAWCTEYRQPFTVHLERAQGMVKTIKAIQRKLDRYADDWGHPRTFADYAMRVCKAVGATEVYVRTGSNGHSYSEQTYSTYAITNLPHVIDRQFERN